MMIRFTESAAYLLWNSSHFRKFK